MRGVPSVLRWWQYCCLRDPELLSDGVYPLGTFGLIDCLWQKAEKFAINKITKLEALMIF